MQYESQEEKKNKAIRDSSFAEDCVSEGSQLLWPRTPDFLSAGPFSGWSILGFLWGRTKESPKKQRKEEFENIMNDSIETVRFFLLLWAFVSGIKRS